MGMYESVWECMGVYGSVWECIGVYGGVWGCVGRRQPPPRTMLRLCGNALILSHTFPYLPILSHKKKPPSTILPAYAAKKKPQQKMQRLLN